MRAGGGTVDVINLPDIGIKGNSHMLMQDKNNAEIAEVIQKWLVGEGLGRLIRIHTALAKFNKQREGAMRRFGIALTFILAAGSAAGADQGTDRAARHGLVPCRRSR